VALNVAAGTYTPQGRGRGREGEREGGRGEAKQ